MRSASTGKGPAALMGSRILDVFLVQAFGLVTFGSLGSVQGSREGVELTSRGGLGRGLQYPRESVKGCVGPRLRVAEGSYSSGKSALALSD